MGRRSEEDSMKLKKKKKGADYDRSVCSAARCKDEAAYTYSTTTPLGVQAGGSDVHLCDRHQEAWASESAPAGEPEVVEKPAGVALAPLPPPDTQGALEKEAADAKAVLQGIEEFEVAEQADLDFADEVLGDVKRAWNELEERKKKATGPMNAALKEIRSWFKPAQDFYSKAEGILKGKIVSAHQKAQEEQDKALREAQVAHQKAQEEQDRIFREAQAAHQRAQEEQGRALREAEEARAIEDEIAERAAIAKAQAASQKAQEAQDQAAREAQVARAKAESEVQEALAKSQAVEIEQPKDVSFVEGWDFEIVDPAKLPREYLVPDVQAIRGTVKALGQGAHIPGVRIFQKTTVVRRNA